jgi:hypothetical protein
MALDEERLMGQRLFYVESSEAGQVGSLANPVKNS